MSKKEEIHFAKFKFPKVEDRLASIGQSPLIKDGVVTDQDIYGDYSKNESDSWLRKFETEVAVNLGKEDAVFCISGGVAQNIALLIGNKGIDNGSFIVHPSSHLLLHENDAYSELLKLKAITSGRRSEPLSFQDIQETFNKNKHEKIGTLILENPHRELGGALSDYEDLLKISHYCKENIIKFHLDGARLWESTGGYNGNYSIKDLTAPFDSVYVSFYKGLGGITGAMLLGNKDFCSEARVWLRRFGANVFSLSPYVISCWDAFRQKHLREGPNASSLSFLNKTEKMKHIVEILQTDNDLQELLTFNPKVPQVCMVQVYIKGKDSETITRAKDMVVKETGIHLFAKIRPHFNGDGKDESGNETYYFEWIISDDNADIDDKLILNTWKTYAKILKEIS